MSVTSSNSTLVFFKAAYPVNPGAERNFARFSSQMSQHFLLKFFISKSLQTVCVIVI